MPLANLYHAPDATAQDRAALVAAWHAMQGVMNGLLVTGLVILPLALLGLASAMRVVPALGRRVGAFSMVLGAIGLGAALLLLVDPLSTVAVVGILVLMLFHLVAGWRLTRMARSETAGHASIAEPRLGALPLLASALEHVLERHECSLGDRV